jgi:hypothetical protein
VSPVKYELGFHIPEDGIHYRSRFSVVFLGPRANAELVYNSTLLCMLHMQPSRW